MNPITVKAVAVIENTFEPNLVSVHVSQNPMWSAALRIKALQKKHPHNVYIRIRVDAVIARDSALADKIRPPKAVDWNIYPERINNEAID